MKDKNIENIAFSKHTPSVFLVMSPFQLLCAIESVHVFDISDYKIVFALSHKYVVRNNQMIQMAEQMSIDYDLQYIDDLYIDDYINDKPIPIFNTESQGIKKYKRIFIGDYPHLGLHILAVAYADKDAIMLYMDDGVASISIFNGLYKGRCYVSEFNKPKLWWDQLSWYKNVYKKQKQKTDRLIDKLRKEGIYCSNCFFSLYGDINTKKYSLYPNTLSYLSTNYRNKVCDREGVFVIGTVIKEYARRRSVQEKDLEEVLQTKLIEVKKKWSDKEIFYIPHGRDVNKNVQSLCESLNITYMMLDSSIEYHIMKSNFYPVALYGFASTALYTLKLLYPQSEVINWQIDNKNEGNTIFYKSSNLIVDYYAKHGIENDSISYNCSSDTNNGMLYNIKYMLKMACKKIRR